MNLFAWKRHRRQGTREAREELWSSILTSFRDTATRSNGFKVIRTGDRPISARVTSMEDLSCLFTGVAPSGLHRKQHRSWVHMRSEYFMRYRCMRILFWCLFCDGIIFGHLQAVQGSPLSMNTLQRCSPQIDPVYLMCTTQPGVSHTSPIHA